MERNEELSQTDTEEDRIPENTEEESSEDRSDRDQPEEVAGNEQQTEQMVTIPASELSEIGEEKDDYYDRLLRLQAEMENFKKRVAREQQTFMKYAAESIVKELLPILDDFDRALEAAGVKDEDCPQQTTGQNEKAADLDPQDDSFIQGLSMIRRQFDTFLEKQNIRQIACVGEKFDPNVHEALMGVPSSEHPDGTVLEEVQKGYVLHDRVIRPAKVKITTQPQETPTEPDAARNS